MRKMSDAPKDGTRILIRAYCQRLTTDNRWERDGDRVVECWWHNDRWSVWLGRANAESTEFIDAIEWFPVVPNKWDSLTTDQQDRIRALLAEEIKDMMPHEIADYVISSLTDREIDAYNETQGN